MEKRQYHPLPIREIIEYLREKKYFAIFDNALCDTENYQSFIFYDVSELRYSYNRNSFEKDLIWAEKMQKQGKYVAGIIPYESGFAIEPAFRCEKEFVFPAIFITFKNIVVFDHISGKFSSQFPVSNSGRINYDWIMKKLWFDTSFPEYKNKIQKIKKYIEKGDTYQVNYTIRCRFTFSGSVYGMYLDLRERQNVPYSAIIKIGNEFILSFSPELFFRKEGKFIKARPMKGTMKRGKNKKQDEKFHNELKNSIKNRAENLMIVDMMRNDLGKICQSGTVITNPIFHIEKYETLFQMTSTITGILKPATGFSKIIKAIFPSASITGAPKIRTMEIIKEIEKSPRKIYTGAIGILKPDKSCVFNVAIRTILIKGHKGEMGTGGGIVYDSKPGKEYRECLLKSAFLVSACKKIQLIETLRWSSDEGYFLLDLHLKRLIKSAQFFHFQYNRRSILKTLEKTASEFDREKIYRVRLLLFQNGLVSVSFKEIPRGTQNIAKAIISKTAIDPNNVFLYHKTTIRHIYDREHKLASCNGYFDVIFKNNSGQITEGAITSVFVEKNGVLLTPPVFCGLLPGVLRQYLLNTKQAEEKILTEEDLFNADRIFLGNSVRGLVEVRVF